MATFDEFALATKRGQELRREGPTATEARYDRRTHRIKVMLSSGVELAFAPQKAQGLENASAQALSKIEITPSGFGLYFPDLDTDIYLPSLLLGILGSRKWAASRLGALGGRSSSAAKISASRRNGKLGGRPRKSHIGNR